MRVRFMALTAAAVAIGVAGVLGAFAANKQDIAKVKNVRKFGQCLKCDLSKADLRNGFFQLAVLIESDLSGAKFDGANMAGAQLNGANMQNGSFTYTNFSGAQLQDTDMRGADVTGAWFNWAWFKGANLDGANFEGAHMIGAQLQGANMAKVLGLTASQLRFACGDADTRLPPGIETPRCPY